MQAFIADDRGLIERLIRFDQAHDLLKNVGRVQKLAQDSTAALEMYQRQVRTLEEQLVLSDGFYGPSSRLLFELFMSERRTALPTRRG